MPVTRYYSSTALPTTLASGISAGSATMTVAATTGFPASFPYTLAVDDGAATLELVEVTNASGTDADHHARCLTERRRSRTALVPWYGTTRPRGTSRTAVCTRRRPRMFTASRAPWWAPAPRRPWPTRP
jgi:hypothetical protein